jgi:glycine cleavage system H protein
MVDKSVVKDGLRYTAAHEWVKVEGDTVRIGITDHAQAEMTEIVFIELPTVGRKYKKGDMFAQVESVKTVASVYAPLDGEVVEVNSTLEAQTQLVNDSPYEEGWFAVMRLDNHSSTDALMDAAAYRKLLSS